MRLAWSALALSLLLPGLGLGASPGAAAEPDAWGWIERARARLAAAPLEADFEQTYLPAGFSSGERETGRIGLDLPECLRWDYATPYAKTFLLCGDTFWAWNEGEASGRRQQLAAEDQLGLDLLRLGAERLRERYRAEMEDNSGEMIRLRLAPLQEGDLEAGLRIETATGLLRELSYRDAEGNLTRFELTGYRPLTRPGGFEPADGVEWLEE